MRDYVNRSLKGNKIKKPIFAFLLIFVITALTGLLYFTVLKKSPSQIYLSAESKNIKNYSEQIKRLYKELYNNQVSYIDNVYRTRTELSVAVDGGKEVLSEFLTFPGAVDILEKSKLIIDTRVNPLEDKSLSDVSFVMQKIPLFSIKSFVQGNKITFSIPDLVPGKAFMFNMNNIDELYNKLGTPSIPLRLIRRADILQALKFDEKQFDTILRDYWSFISNLIEEEDVKYGQIVKVDIGDQEIEGREVIVNLESKKSKAVFQSLLKKIRSDRAFQEYTYGNYVNIVNLLKHSGLLKLFSAFEVSGGLELNSDIKAVLDVLEEEKSVAKFRSRIDALSGSVEFPEGLVMKLIIDRSGNILERKVSFSYREADSDYIRKVNIYTRSNNLKSNNLGNRYLTFQLTTVNSEGEELCKSFTVNPRIEELSENKSLKGTIEITYSKSENKTEEFAVSSVLGIEKSVDQNTMRENSVLKYDIVFHGENKDLKDRFIGEIKSQSWKNEKRKTRNTALKHLLNINLPSMDINNVRMVFDVKTEDKFEIGESEILNLRTEEIIDLNDASADKIKQIKNEVLEALTGFFLKILGL